MIVKDISYIPALKWLWENRNKPYIFGTSVLTEENRKDDSTTIDPPLTPVESENLFQFLSRKQLLFKQGNGHYIINKVEAHKWNNLISDLKRWDWTRHWFWTAWGKTIVLFTVTILGGVVGAIATKWTENKLSATKHEIIRDGPQPSPQQSPSNNQNRSDNNSNPVITEPIPRTTPNATPP